MTPKTNASKQIYNLIYNTYFESIPLDKIFEILRSNGFYPIDESGQDWDGILCGKDSRTIISIRDSKFSLNLSWYKMPSGRFEVTAYIQ